MYQKYNILITLGMLLHIGVAWCKDPTSTKRPGYEIIGKSWKKEDIPNPQKDTWKCGQEGKASWICNPDKILSTWQVNRIDTTLGDQWLIPGECHCDSCDDKPMYGGFQVGVAIVNKLDIKEDASSGDKKKAGKTYAHYLRKDWKFGECDDDLFILISAQEQIVYTDMGSKVKKMLSESCAQDIEKENEDYFKEPGVIADGISRLLDEYKAVLKKERKCDNKHMTVIIGAVVVGFIVMIVIMVACIVIRRVKSKARRSATI